MYVLAFGDIIIVIILKGHNQVKCVIKKPSS